MAQTLARCSDNNRFANHCLVMLNQQLRATKGFRTDCESRWSYLLWLLLCYILQGAMWVCLKLVCLENFIRQYFQQGDADGNTLDDGNNRVAKVHRLKASTVPPIIALGLLCLCLGNTSAPYAGSNNQADLESGINLEPAMPGVCKGVNNQFPLVQTAIQYGEVGEERDFLALAGALNFTQKSFGWDPELSQCNKTVHQIMEESMANDTTLQFCVRLIEVERGAPVNAGTLNRTYIASPSTTCLGHAVEAYTQALKEVLASMDAWKQCTNTVSSGQMVEKMIYNLRCRGWGQSDKHVLLSENSHNCAAPIRNNIAKTGSGMIKAAPDDPVWKLAVQRYVCEDNQWKLTGLHQFEPAGVVTYAGGRPLIQH